MMKLSFSKIGYFETIDPEIHPKNAVGQAVNGISYIFYK